MSAYQIIPRIIHDNHHEYSFSELGSEFQEFKWSHCVTFGICPDFPTQGIKQAGDDSQPPPRKQRHIHLTVILKFDIVA